MIYKEIYHIKRVDESDFPAIKTLFWKVFKKRVSIEYLQNKYNTSYLGIKYICSIAYLGDIPVAFYGALPQKFTCDGKKTFVAHACDSYTMPDHQRKGLHYQLASFAYDIMKSYGVKYVYAFHSENTYQSTKKLQWKEHKELQRFHVKIKTLPIAKVLNKLKLSKIYSLFYSKYTSVKSQKLILSRHKEKYRQEFTEAFVNYKNNFNNHYFIECHDCIFWVKIKAIMHIGLFYAESETKLKKAISTIKRKAFIMGISELLFQVDAKSTMAEQLQAVTTPKPSWLVGYLDFEDDVDLNEYLFCYADLDTF